ncbi:MAG: PLP-dependent aminotransferase family protein [Roseibium sp.]|nr:PLP-dependent aminotransferase family protein [Roseibium sp.]
MWIPDLSAPSGPIYLAIANAIESDVKSGVLSTGDRLPPQRELAYQLGVTLGTVTRAYAEAERRRLLRGETGRGTFVAPESPAISPLIPSEEDDGRLDLARNFAYPHLNPDLSAGLMRLARTPGVDRLNGFVPSEGLKAHRETGALLFSHYGLTADPAQVALTCGAQHGIQILLQALFRPGDALAVDAYTYPSIIHSAPNLGLRLVPVPGTSTGKAGLDAMDPDALASAARSQAVKGVFLMPNMQNPTTHTMSLDERRALVTVARRHGLRIIEDDPYTPFVSDHPPAFGALAPDLTASIASISKLISPGSRIGFVNVPAPFMPEVRSLIGESTWMASPITAELIAGWVRDGTLDKTVLAKKKENARRYRYAVGRFGEARFIGSDEKVFAWLRLPEDLDSQGLETSLTHQGIAVLAARHFQPEMRRPAPYLRITLGSVAGEGDFRSAIDRVALAIERGETPAMRREPVG